MDIRARYWDVMQDLAETRYGCACVLEKLNARDCWMNAIIAALACGGVTVFLTWDAARLWGGIAAAIGQVAAAVKPVLEISRRRETLVDVIGRLCMLSCEIERDFVSVELKSISDDILLERIHYYNSMHSNIAQTLTNHGISFGDFKGVAENAGQQAEAYIKRIAQIDN